MPMYLVDYDLHAPAHSPAISENKRVRCDIQKMMEKAMESGVIAYYSSRSVIITQSKALADKIRDLAIGKGATSHTYELSSSNMYETRLSGDMIDRMGSHEIEKRVRKPRLSPDDVRRIRQEYPARTQGEIAESYGINQGIVSLIVHHKTYKSVLDDPPTMPTDPQPVPTMTLDNLSSEPSSDR